MIPIPSAIDGQSFLLQELEQVMKPLGYVINGGWEYDHGYFDYKIDDRDGYLFLRIPVNAVQGSLDERGAAVRIGTPFMLRQVFQADVDDHAEGGLSNHCLINFPNRKGGTRKLIRHFWISAPLS